MIRCKKRLCEDEDKTTFGGGRKNMKRLSHYRVEHKFCLGKLWQRPAIEDSSAAVEIDSRPRLARPHPRPVVLHPRGALPLKEIFSAIVALLFSVGHAPSPPSPFTLLAVDDPLRR
ncbi:hypothetical protein HN51_028083 [Arachis hypogaea]